MTNTLANVQAMLCDATCPQCNDRRFDLSLRCDLSFGECLYTMTCEGCGLVYHVEKPDEGDDTATSRCTECNDGNMLLTMICSNDTHSCREVYACERCCAVDVRDA